MERPAEGRTDPDDRLSRTEVLAALDRFDRAFAAGDADALADLFAPDASLLLLYREPLVGREAVQDEWRRAFAAFDPGAWRTQRVIVDVHGDRAHTLSTYTETLVSRQGKPSQSISGRVVLFLRRRAADEWEVTLALNSHSRPVEFIDP
jgi:uncharacterized protein (TIGR02246 family)